MSRVWRWLGEIDEAMNRFDLVDRIIVFIFMFITMFLLIYVLDQELTPTEGAEVAPVIEGLSYLLLFFVVWPLIHLALTKIGRYVVKRWRMRGEAA